MAPCVISKYITVKTRDRYNFQNIHDVSMHALVLLYLKTEMKQFDIVQSSDASGLFNYIPFAANNSPTIQTYKY